MSSEQMTRLQQMLEREPRDAFLLYAIALEHKKQGDYPAALDYFRRVLDVNPDYAVAYHHAGLTYEAAGDLEQARASYRAGIAVALRNNDAHAAREMEDALSLIE